MTVVDWNDERPSRMGGSAVDYIAARSILTRPTGFAGFYDYSLNPYAGCTFGCSYCYAAAFARDPRLAATWGRWVHVKENALALLAKRRKRPIVDETIFLSTVTDPYQPVEKELGLTRAVLVELLRYHRARVVVQTRSPLITRDIDLLRAFEFAQVNMTVTTDDDAIRRRFEPTCSSIDQRLDAITEVAAAGVPAGVTMTPLLPVTDAEAFARRLLATGAVRFGVQHFHPGSGRFVSGTPDDARALYAELGWTYRRYAETRRVLAAMLPHLAEAQCAFVPWWAEAEDVPAGC